MKKPRQLLQVTTLRVLKKIKNKKVLDVHYLFLQQPGTESGTSYMWIMYSASELHTPAV